MDNNDILKTVNSNGDVYVIRKFDARTGLKIARMVVAKATPIIPLLDVDDKENAIESANSLLEGKDKNQVYEMVGKMLESLSDADIDNLIDKCLRVCSKQLPAGLQPVIDAIGNYGVEGVEYDMALTLRLVYEAISWGAADFFGVKGLAGLLRKK